MGEQQQCQGGRRERRQAAAPRGAPTPLQPAGRFGCSISLTKDGSPLNGVIKPRVVFQAQPGLRCREQGVQHREVIVTILMPWQASKWMQVDGRSGGSGGSRVLTGEAFRSPLLHL